MSATSGVVDFFIHPPLGLLRRIEIEGSPFNGQGTLPDPNAGGLLGSAYGLVWFVNNFPPGVGQLDGRVITFEPRILQFDVQHDFLSFPGDRMTDQVFETSFNRGMFFFQNDLPSQIDYWIFPGFFVRLWWLSL